MAGKIKPSPLKIHLVAACGTGMGTLACILKEMGHGVTGSDRNVYPPMSDFLAEKGVKLFSGFDPANLDEKPDLVIIGNAVTRDNPEARAVMERDIPYLSMPQAVNRFIASDKKIILVTGTHGKTTTSSIMAHILTCAGMDPSFMIGGILKDYHSSFRIGMGEYMVIEGDEYDTAFFDKGPKFMHYDPHITIMTGVEFDHADIFRDLDHIRVIFADFVKKIQPSSHIIACLENETLMEILESCRASMETYGQGREGPGDWYASDHEIKGGFTLAGIHGPGRSYNLETKLVGHHNLLNFLACAAAAQKIGIEPEQIQKAMASFSGIKRRQEIRGIKSGITIMDDFAHHPSAVRETIAAVRPFYRQGRVIAVFEPRTNTSMRRFFQDSYPGAFTEADMVCICKPCVKKDIPDPERFSPEKLASDINSLGVEARCFERVDDILEFLPPVLQRDDLVLIMSNGGFDNIHARILERISG
ncbi:UDP-N-acetylmuramate:L-alanyl-gamma-D-glutamyl-meso-diaminopimelate ligase [Desulfospira joergensenii]|uniref:UDP-N-acetylmuramate:L-alanyl-gamma-D-glutamyl- meso-diaminopimelate ligase n=1 Tax=Desulfospira joergensenii TaxID=53329 RepID=UPI0003B77610|nr:UDP-N-acetylmuramate:L-alanyl-gamma-D-glutamyl-meso-diaminopimelate ligase [Desulfospira joergensenii]